MSDEEARELHICILPFIVHGHIIPALDMAKLFSDKGAKSTIVTIPLNSRIIEKSIEGFKNREIGIKILDFPSTLLGLPEGCDDIDFFVSHFDKDADDSVRKVIASAKILQEQLEHVMETMRPDCLVADSFFPWATEAAAKFGVPRLVFHATCYFSLCAITCVILHKPHKKVASCSETFEIPDLPGNILITSEQITDADDEDTEMGKYMKDIWESEKKSFGALVNSCYELESPYADFYRSVVGHRSWHIGPLFLCDRATEERADRSEKANTDRTECLKWLDSKKPNSVIYMAFGSMTRHTNAQLTEIAAALESCEQDFIWVVRKDDNKGEKEEWLPQGFEERSRGKGLIVRGWAPQRPILGHGAVGGFVTHCGWNSVIEGVASGLPMATWPVGAEQFYNEKLVTQVMRIGVSVGARKWVRLQGDFITKERVEKAMRDLMVGEEAEERRGRAKELAVMAKAAMEEGGSSYNGVNMFMEEVRLLRDNKEKDEEGSASTLSQTSISFT